MVIAAAGHFRSAPKSDRSAALKWRAAAAGVMIVVAIAAGWLLVQGPWLDSSTFFVPWHHDDFDILSNFGFQVLSVRPVSRNLLFNAGYLGPYFLYSALTATWMLGFGLTFVLILRVFELKLNLGLAALLAGIGSCTLFALACSAQAVQYSGLGTNALSYFFGMAAAVLIVSAGRRTNVVHYLAISAFSFLSAFAKEDMAPFLEAACVLAGLRVYARGASLASAVRSSLLLALIVAVCFVLSIVFALVGHSPFVGGSGDYDVSYPLHNILGNGIKYVTLSSGAEIVLCSFAIVTLVAVCGNAKLRQPAVQAVWVLGAVVALTLPYLLLPRFFDYYGLNFIPLIALSIGPAILAIGLSMGWSQHAATVLAVAGAGLVAIATFVTDEVPRNAALSWLTNVRSVSRAAIAEVHRIADNELRDCGTVKVTGASDTFGPFLATSASYLDGELRQKFNWEIAYEPGTILEGFAPGRSRDRWQYIPRKSMNLTLGPAECSLEFEPQTRHAELHRAQ
jgi:hypothetical protein